MKKVLLILIICSISVQAFSQMRFVNKVINHFFPEDTTRHNSFMLLPLAGYNQEAGFMIGGAGLYSFYTDIHDLTIRPSQASLSLMTSTKGQTQLGFKSDLWSKKNLWHQIYTLQFYNNPFNYYGIGNATLEADKNRLKQLKLRVNAEVERNFLKNYYAGIGAEYESHQFKDKDPGGIFTHLPISDQEGGQFLILKITQVYDSRNSNTYPTRGFFGKLKYGYAPDFFGKDKFHGNFYSADVRQFIPLRKDLVLAGKLLFEGLDSKTPVPFYAMRQMGNDEIMRGYYLGRYRDNYYLAMQSELRYRFSDRFGIVAFGGVGNVAPHANETVKSLKPNYGVGGRFFFDLDKNLAVRLDYGMGEKRPGEKRISGFYFALSEAF